MTSIFVQVPSYRDFELPKTILSAINNSSGKNKIHFGISNVVLYSNEIYIPNQINQKIKISYRTSIAPENIGLQKSRKIANNFYNNEDYYLQIDSHMRFDKNWDIELIKNVEKYKTIGFEKPLLSTYPPGYWYDHFMIEQYGELNNTNCISFLENIKNFEDTYIPSQTAKITDPSCCYTASVSGGFIFTLGSYAEMIPNEKIAFWGEEILIAARAYTHGFDLLLPDRSYLWHLYYNHEASKQINGRYHVWEDFPELWVEMEKETKIELERIFKNKVIGINELGSVRTLDQYGEYCGLDFDKKNVNQPNWG